MKLPAHVLSLLVPSFARVGNRALCPAALTLLVACDAGPSPEPVRTRVLEPEVRVSHAVEDASARTTESASSIAADSATADAATADAASSDASAPNSALADAGRAGKAAPAHAPRHNRPRSAITADDCMACGRG